jgi:hypothetical protein
MFIKACGLGQSLQLFYPLDTKSFWTTKNFWRFCVSSLLVERCARYTQFFLRRFAEMNMHIREIVRPVWRKQLQSINIMHTNTLTAILIQHNIKGEQKKLWIACGSSPNQGLSKHSSSFQYLCRVAIPLTSLIKSIKCVPYPSIVKYYFLTIVLEALFIHKIFLGFVTISYYWCRPLIFKNILFEASQHRSNVSGFTRGPRAETTTAPNWLRLWFATKGAVSSNLLRLAPWHWARFFRMHDAML